MMELYFENNIIRIYVDKELHLGIGEWKGFASSNEFRETVLRSLETVNKYKLTRWLADRRNMKAIRQQDQQWTVEEFIPKLLESPLRRMATIVSEDLFNRMAIENMIQRSGGLGNIVLSEFNNTNEALKWLEQPIEQEVPHSNSGTANTSR
ncbi:hypothetical protein [Pontibacter cellulosilyticus]|uniref:STAS/SEC14 domain-containing protein n=1 Tax=Pontibacter cellulosilyticus TaxID=1720253 RepID=A0A923N7D5_9BACT|nr:hypothetical protein [Pontibacter cellulosilyticus]MBC5994048.1 hypothetical protein [Pontibacter cellulosilyticus]